MFKWLKARLTPQKLTYDEARAALEKHSLTSRQLLAAQGEIEPEILYFLAGDESADVRRLVAANPATPQQANKILTDDPDEEVRCELARKIGRLVPGLSDEETQRVRDLAIEVMERLAKDSLPRVRALLAEEIKTARNVPAHIVQILARDLELIVRAPILEFSPLLSDEDLIEIIAGARVEGSLAAIAKRSEVSEPVADAIVASLDVSAIASLLANPNAKIREEALDRVLEHAAEIEAWHQPVVMRADLSLRAVRRIAGFVSSALLEVLSKHSRLDEDTASYLRKRVRERIDEEGLAQDSTSRDANALAAVQDVQRRGLLNDEFVAESIDRNERRVVVCALSQLAQVPVAAVDRILMSQSGKAITALTWRAKLPMRLAVKIQSGLAHLSGPKMLMARDGVHFPLSQDEMLWHLNYFGVKT